MRQQTVFQHVQAEGGKCGRRAHKQDEQPAALTRHLECKPLLKALPIHAGSAIASARPKHTISPSAISDGGRLKCVISFSMPVSRQKHTNRLRPGSSVRLS